MYAETLLVELSIKKTPTPVRIRTSEGPRDPVRKGLMPMIPKALTGTGLIMQHSMPRASMKDWLE